MFTWINKQGVKSTKGFVVQSVGRFNIEYRELTKVILLNVENGLLENGQACVYIYPDEFTKWNDGSPISIEKQNEIMKNFKEAMEFQGVAVLTD